MLDRVLHSLYTEVSILKGMIAEIVYKTQIWKERLLDDNLSLDFIKAAEMAEWQMREDLAKYSYRLKDIVEELKHVVEFS